MSNWQQTIKLIPEGVQTLSKRPCVHVDGVYPKWIVKGKGCHVFDEAGKEYIDWPCSLGAVILGHAFDPVVKAVKDQLDEGILFSLSNPKETELAELLHDVFPSLEMMRFVKTGSESCSAAVKIARAYMGRWPILCSGYHGWHSWYNCTTPKNAGSPIEDVTPFKWGDTRKLEELLIDKKPAGVILEPFIYETEKEIETFLKEVRRLTDVHKVILIFDENVTGFRTKKLSAQAYWKVIPDLTCLGKAMGNGVPIACVGGKRDIMDVLTKDCFVSSTFGGDLIGISAAIATISYLKNHPVTEHIWTIGSQIKTAFNLATQACMMESVKCIGLPPRTHFIFPSAEHKGLFWQECLKLGVFFGHAQFVSYAHKQPELDTTTMAIRQALKMVHKHFENPSEALQGKPPVETLRLVTVPAPLQPIQKSVPIPLTITKAEADEIGFVGQNPSGETTVAAVVERRKPSRPRKVTDDNEKM